MISKISVVKSFAQNFWGPEGSGVLETSVNLCPRNFCGSALSQKFLRLVVLEISVDPCLRNFCGRVVVSEISADELLSQKFLRVSRCLRNFCGRVFVSEISAGESSQKFLRMSRCLRNFCG